MYDLFYHSRFSAKNFLTNFAARFSKFRPILPKECSEAKYSFGKCFFSSDGMCAKLLQTFEKCFDKINETGYYAVETKAFSLPKNKKSSFWEMERNFFYF